MIKKGIKPQLSLPLLRFKGFEGEWEKRKIEDICFNSKNDLLQNNNFLDAPSIMKKKYDIYNSQEYKLSPMNSIVFIKDGSNAGNFFYNYEGSKIASTCDYIEVNQNPLFVYYFLEGKINFIINNLLIGETIPHLYKKTLNKCIINIPPFSEQQKIAKFFSLLDKQISLWERKLELYELFYKYYLNKLIPNKYKTKNKAQDVQRVCFKEIFVEKNMKILGKSIKQASVGKLGFRLRDEVFKSDLKYKSDYQVKIVEINEFVLGMGSHSIDLKLNTLNRRVGVSTAYKVFECSNKKVVKYINYFFERNLDYFTNNYMIISARQGKSVNVKDLFNEDVIILENHLNIVKLLDYICINNDYLSRQINKMILLKTWYMKYLFV